MSLTDAMKLDTIIAVYLALAGVIILAILYQIAEMFWHTYRMRRALRRQHRLLRFHRVSIVALLIINIANRITEWRERYHAWRHGDTAVGDRLIDRMEKL